MNTTPKVIFMFLDGMGIGAADDTNPLYRFGLFRDIVGEHIAGQISVLRGNLAVKGIDACLDTPGIPQSATGQTALFTGRNAAKLLGYHVPAFPTPELREIIQENNIFMQATTAGKKATFANAYRAEYFAMVEAGKRLHSVTTVSCLASKVALRNVEDYTSDRAISWDITGEYMKTQTAKSPRQRSPEAAGEILCGLSKEFDLVVFESFLPDLIGHARDWEMARKFCDTLSRFVKTIIAGIDEATTLLISSDHGNFEDFLTGSHTRNPVIMLAAGPAASSFNGAESIVDIPKLIDGVLRK